MWFKVTTKGSVRGTVTGLPGHQRSAVVLISGTIRALKSFKHYGFALLERLTLEFESFQMPLTTDDAEFAPSKSHSKPTHTIAHVTRTKSIFRPLVMRESSKTSKTRKPDEF